MRAMSGRRASCRATSLPIPALAPVISTVFPGSALIVIPSHLLRVQPGSTALAGLACAGAPGVPRRVRALAVAARFENAVERRAMRQRPGGRERDDLRVRSASDKMRALPH